MTLHPPFFIGSNLRPALRVGDAVLSLDEIRHSATPDGRDVAVMVLDLPGNVEYIDDQMRSGCGGFRGSVEVFETFLSFLSAAGESVRYGAPDYIPGPDDNGSLFPIHVSRWAGENFDEISSVGCDLMDEYSGGVLHHLIED